MALTLTSKITPLNILNRIEIPGYEQEIQVGWSEVHQSIPESVLSDFENEEFQSFTNERRKHEYLTSRMLFRELLSETDWDYPEIKLEKNDMGKPVVIPMESGIHISFSHSNELVVCAISRAYDIGVDVESKNRVINERVVRRILSEREWEIYTQEDPIKLWTVKESLVKSLGTGFRTNLNQLEVTLRQNNQFSAVLDEDVKLMGVYMEVNNHGLSIAFPERNED